MPYANVYARSNVCAKTARLPNERPVPYPPGGVDQRLQEREIKTGGWDSIGHWYSYNSWWLIVCYFSATVDEAIAFVKKGSILTKVRSKFSKHERYFLVEDDLSVLTYSGSKKCSDQKRSSHRCESKSRSFLLWLVNEDVFNAGSRTRSQRLYYDNIALHKLLNNDIWLIAYSLPRFHCSNFARVAIIWVTNDDIIIFCSISVLFLWTNRRYEIDMRINCIASCFFIVGL